MMKTNNYTFYPWILLFTVWSCSTFHGVSVSLFQVLTVCAGQDEPTLLAEECTDADNTTCYSLYETVQRPLNWPAAYNACLAEGKRLVTIPDAQAQNVLERLLSNEFPGSNDRSAAWLSGQRSADSNWVYVSGENFAGNLFFFLLDTSLMYLRIQFRVIKFGILLL